MNILGHEQSMQISISCPNHKEGDIFLTNFGNEFPEILALWREKEEMISS
jgi:hypothetical protein